MPEAFLLAMASAATLSPRKVQDIFDTALTCVSTVISYANFKKGPITWSLESTQGDYSLYKGIEPAPYTKSASSGLFCSTMEICGTLDEVMEHFRTNTTEKAQELARRIGKKAIDSIILATLPPPRNSSIEDVVIRWNLGKTVLDHLARKRDMCVVECGYSFEVNGRRGWVRASQSIKVDSCPDLEATMGYVRMENRGSGLVFVESDRPGRLVAYQVTHMDLRGNATELLTQLCLRNGCGRLKELDRHLRENRLSRGPWLEPQLYAAHTSTDNCYRCEATFSMFRRKTNCQKCGQVVCSNCNQSWQVKVNGQVTKMHACTICSLLPPPSAVKDVDNCASEDGYFPDSFLSQAYTVSASSYIEIAGGEDTSDGLYYVL
ncbi:unnamed protein product [Aphanomyces euteiches]|uniref:FYVE-type domain-containing protein n=1 Tax=Aphanomyces euteiches TaxID=100861 RepID=A0A6G0WQE5_9STRA|nr:hypothetical protein Ae201684_012710 [Aphanomyces euteiches]KAH9146837.1 hypothetical protein AeRB84_009341 [Aphanomyces euteiches]